MLSAVCFPILTLLFGRVFKEFINYNIADKIYPTNLTEDYYCNLSDDADITEYLHPDRHHQLHIRIASLTFLNLAVSLAFFAVAALSRSLSAVAAAQMGRNLRHEYFNILIKRHIGWFEGDNYLSELPSTLLLE